MYNNIMDVKTLGELCNIVAGGTPSRSNVEFWENGTIPWIKIGNIKGKYIQAPDEFITQKGLDNSSAKMLPKGTVLYTIFATLGEVGILNIDACTNQAIAGLTIKDEKQLNTDYLYYYLVSKKTYVNTVGRGVAQNNINMSILRSFKLPLLPICEQKKIVKILDKVNDLRNGYQLVISSLDNLIKARFVEMFDLSECVYGTFGKDTDFVDYRGKTPELSDVGTIRMVNAKSVGKGVFKTVNEYVTDEVYEKWMHRGLGYPGDILFVTEGHTFGNTCLVPDYLKKFALGQRVITIKGHSEVIDNAFLGTYMQMEQFKQDIDVYKTGGTAQGIRSKDLLKIRLPLPKYKEQKEFADFIKQVDKSKVVHYI